MADLVTHVCVVALPALVARSRWTAPLALGAALPDLLGRVVPIALDLVDRALVPVPEPVLWAWPALHEPLGASAVASLVALAAVPADRGAAWRALLVGVASHTALDLLQDHHGAGYLVAAPLSTVRVEFGWLPSEATVAIAWPLLGVTALAALRAALTRSTTGTRSARPPGPR